MKDATHVPEGVTPSPPLQFFEQQSPGSVQASPRVLQPLPPGSGAHFWFTRSQLPVQQSADAVHGSSSCLHIVPPQVPRGAAGQESVQHSPAEAQAAPSGLQNAVVVQLPLLQTLEQQSVEDAQEVPAVPQVTVGEAHTPEPPDVSHRPEQQSAASVQAAVRAAH